MIQQKDRKLLHPNRKIVLPYWACSPHPNPSSGSPTTEEMWCAYTKQTLDICMEIAEVCKEQLPRLLVGLDGRYQARYRGRECY